MVLLSSDQVSQEFGEMALKGLSQHGTNQVTSEKQLPKRTTATEATFRAELYGSKASYRTGFPSLNIPRSSVLMCYIANLKDFLEQNKDS